MLQKLASWIGSSSRDSSSAATPVVILASPRSTKDDQAQAVANTPKRPRNQDAGLDNEDYPLTSSGDRATPSSRIRDKNNTSTPPMSSRSSNCLSTLAATPSSASRPDRLTGPHSQTPPTAPLSARRTGPWSEKRKSGFGTSPRENSSYTASPLNTMTPPLFASSRKSELDTGMTERSQRSGSLGSGIRLNFSSANFEDEDDVSSAVGIATTTTNTSTATTMKASDFDSAKKRLRQLGLTKYEIMAAASRPAYSPSVSRRSTNNSKSITPKKGLEFILPNSASTLRSFATPPMPLIDSSTTRPRFASPLAPRTSSSRIPTAKVVSDGSSGLKTPAESIAALSGIPSRQPSGKTITRSSSQPVTESLATPPSPFAASSTVEQSSVKLSLSSPKSEVVDVDVRKAASMNGTEDEVELTPRVSRQSFIGAKTSSSNQKRLAASITALEDSVDQPKRVRPLAVTRDVLNSEAKSSKLIKKDANAKAGKQKIKIAKETHDSAQQNIEFETSKDKRGKSASKALPKPKRTRANSEEELEAVAASDLDFDRGDEYDHHEEARDESEEPKEIMMAVNADLKKDPKQAIQKGSTGSGAKSVPVEKSKGGNPSKMQKSRQPTQRNSKEGHRPKKTNSTDVAGETSAIESVKVPFPTVLSQHDSAELRKVFEDTPLFAKLRARVSGSTASKLFFGIETARTRLGSILRDAHQRGKSASVLLLGAQGSGKTFALEGALDDIKPLQYHIVSLKGILLADDRAAAREISRQLSLKEHTELIASINALDGEDLDGAPTSSFSQVKKGTFHEHLRNLVRVLKTERDGGRLLFVLDQFEEFAMRPKQTLLYALLDLAHSSDTKFVVVASSTAVDCLSTLDKRVKSRFDSVTLCFPHRGYTVEEAMEFLRDRLFLEGEEKWNGKLIRALEDAKPTLQLLLWANRETPGSLVEYSLKPLLMRVRRTFDEVVWGEGQLDINSILARRFLRVQDELIKTLPREDIVLLMSAIYAERVQKSESYSFHTLFELSKKIRRGPPESNFDDRFHLESTHIDTSRRFFEELLSRRLLESTSKSAVARNIPRDHRPVRLRIVNLDEALLKYVEKTTGKFPPVLVFWARKLIVN